MSPFSRYLVELRRRYGLRQNELAELVGYEQSYLSGLEIGQKGPPTAEFVERLGKALSLPDEEKRTLQDAFRASHRKFTIPRDAEEEIFWLYSDLRDRLPNLSVSHIKVMREVLRLCEPKVAQQTDTENRQIKEEVRM